MAASSEVSLVALAKKFGDTVAVDAIDAEIAPASYCCLPGPSGCGKTTTLRMIAGHEMPTSGEIVLGDPGYSTPEQYTKEITIANDGICDQAQGWRTSEPR